MTDVTGQIILFVICLLLSGFFSGSEVALISMNQAKVRTLIEKKAKGSNAIKKLTDNYDHLLITILIGNNIVNVGAAAIATSIAISIYGNIGIGIATGVVTLLMLIFGEIGPKTYATRHAERVSQFVARPILVFQYILTPVLWIYDLIKKVFSTGAMTHPEITEEELKTWIDVGEEAGTIEEEEHEMLYRVFRFNDTIAREAMTQRGDVTMIEDTATLDDSIAIFNETGFSRIPVYHEEQDNIIGTINVKDVFAAIFEKRTGVTLRDLLYEPFFVPESKIIDDLLKEMQNSKIHLALVVDEYGSFAGIITIEDIIEELVGEIMDEFDEEEPEIQQIDDQTYLIDAGTWVEKINKELELSLPLDESYETIGGLFFHQYGKIPKRGREITLEESGILLRVATMHLRRIVEIELVIPEKNGVTNEH